MLKNCDRNKPENETKSRRGPDNQNCLVSFLCLAMIMGCARNFFWNISAIMKIFKRWEVNYYHNKKKNETRPVTDDFGHANRGTATGNQLNEVAGEDEKEDVARLGLFMDNQLPLGYCTGGCNTILSSEQVVHEKWSSLEEKPIKSYVYHE